MSSILVVDDEYDILHALDLILSTEGHQVMKASNGREALDRLAQSLPDIVLLDAMMPVMNGYETARAIRADNRYMRVPVVMMSAMDPKAPQDGGLWDAFLKKPFEIDRLLSLITSLAPET